MKIHSIGLYYPELENMSSHKCLIINDLKSLTQNQ